MLFSLAEPSIQVETKHVGEDRYGAGINGTELFV